MARKKEGFRSGSSAKPSDTHRGAGRAPSIDSKESIESIIGDAKDKKDEQVSKDKEKGPVSEYETVIDEIVALVNEQESVQLTELSKKFGVNYARLEEWGRILDRDGLLELEYPMVGDIMLRKKGYRELHKKKTGKKSKKKEDNADDRNKGELNEKKIEERKAEEIKEPEKREEARHGEKKKLSKKRFTLIMIGFAALIAVLIGVLVYSLSKSGVIKLV